MTRQPSAAPSRLRTARVLRAHGVRGEVRAEPCGADLHRFAPGVRLEVEDGSRTLTVRTARPASGGMMLLTFDEVRSPSDAAALRGAYLCVGLEAARPLGEDEWFVWQLVGLRAVTSDGTELGTVADVESGVGNDVLVVEGDGVTHRLPMVRAFVTGVDLGAGTLTVAPWVEETA